MFEIEKMDPHPPSRRGESKYPFGKLEVGHGFYVPQSSLRSVQALASRFSKDGAKRFVVRRDGERVQVCRVEVKA